MSDRPIPLNHPAASRRVAWSPKEGSLAQNLIGHRGDPLPFMVLFFVQVVDANSDFPMIEAFCIPYLIGTSYGAREAGTRPVASRPFVDERRDADGEELSGEKEVQF